ncbi:MAG: tetratricopeptide repeat protein [Bacteroidetes bacterium]|nr:tetratricopeptide repeat protein [Bacteroidota bacterium]
MKKSCLIHIFILAMLSLCQLSVAYCQSSKTDSLLTVLKNTKDDTLKVNLLNQLFDHYEFENAVKANEYLTKATELSQRINYKKGLARCFMNSGYFADDTGNYEQAFIYYQQSLKISIEIEDNRGIAASYNNIGGVNESQGNYYEALKNHFVSLKIREAIGDKKGIASAYNNIGNIYDMQGNSHEALKNQLASLKIEEALGNKKGIADSYSSVANAYFGQGNYSEALKNQLASLKMFEEIGDKHGIANSYNNIGLMYLDQITVSTTASERENLFAEVLKNYFYSLNIKKSIGYKEGIASSYSNIGNVFIKQKKYSDAEEYLNKAKELAKEIGYKEILKSTYGHLTNLDSAKRNYKGAYENHKLYILYRDSLDNEETRKKTIQSQMTYEFEKKEAVAETEHNKELENQEELSEEKSRKQRIIIAFVICGLLLVIVFAGFVFRSLRVTRKQKELISEQKELVEEQKLEVEQQKNRVEEKQKEIIDSINYARRIQQSLLPTEKYIEKNLKRLQKN